MFDLFRRHDPVHCAISTCGPPPLAERTNFAECFEGFLDGFKAGGHSAELVRVYRHAMERKRHGATNRTAVEQPVTALLQAIPQPCAQRRVRRRHGVVEQAHGANPGEFGVFAGLHEAVPTADQVERHQEVTAGVGGAREHEGGQAIGLDADAEFFVELADQRGFGRLAGFDLAAGKLPQPGERLALGAAADQHAAVLVDDRGRDDQEDVGQLR